MFRTPPKNRRGIFSSLSVLISYPHLSKFIAESYTNKDNHDDLSGLVITRREVTRVVRRDQLCICMQHEDFKDYELYFVQRWVRAIIEGSETHMFKYSEYQKEGGGLWSYNITIRLLVMQLIKTI